VTLIDALSTAGGGRNVVFVASPSTAAAMKTWAPARFDYEILPSAAVAKNTLIAIEAPAFASAFSAIPEFSTTRQGTVHENTVPLNIVDGEGTVASPTRSLWQTDTFALRTILRCSFGMRSSGLVQYISSVTWIKIDLQQL